MFYCTLSVILRIVGTETIHCDAYVPTAWGDRRHGQQLLGQAVSVYMLGLHRILALANSKFGHFSQILPNSASAKFLAEFGRIWQTPMQLQCVQLVT